MWLGTHQLGDIIPLSIQTLDGSGSPVAPDDHPIAAVFLDGSLVEVFKIPLVDSVNSTGVFVGRLRLGSSYSAGKGVVIYNWEISSTPKTQADHFDVLGGGHADGNAIAATYYPGTISPFAVAQFDSGKLIGFRNPRQ